MRPKLVVGKGSREGPDCWALAGHQHSRPHTHDVPGTEKVLSGRLLMACTGKEILVPTQRTSLGRRQELGQSHSQGSGVCQLLLAWVVVEAMVFSLVTCLWFSCPQKGQKMKFEHSKTMGYHPRGLQPTSTAETSYPPLPTPSHSVGRSAVPHYPAFSPLGQNAQPLSWEANPDLTVIRDLSPFQGPPLKVSQLEQDTAPSPGSSPRGSSTQQLRPADLHSQGKPGHLCLSSFLFLLLH